MSTRWRAWLVAIAACGASLALAAGSRDRGVSLLPAIFILAEFTGGWIAVAIAASLLGLASLFGLLSFNPLMLTAVSALLCARAMRAGLPTLLSILLVAAASMSADAITARGDPAAWWSADSVASTMLLACFNLALVTLTLVVRPPAKAWVSPLRRWRVEDVLFLVSVAALLPLAAVRTSSTWFTVAAIFAVQACIPIVSATWGRVTGRLVIQLKDGRVRAARRRSPRLVREMAELFLGARRVSDDLHRRTARQGLQLESAKLRAGRLQESVEALHRERRRTELALTQATGAAEETDRRWRGFLDAVPEALFITDRLGRIEYVNEGVRHLLGHDPDKLKGRRITSLMPASQGGADPLELGSPFLDADGVATPVERQAQFSDARGASRLLSARVQGFQFPDGPRLCIRVREASGALQRARDQFVATMSHEIRTPLHGLMATLDMLRSESLSAEGGRRLGIARTSAKALIRIANDILDLTRISAGGMQIERKAMSLERLVLDVVDEARAREEALRLHLDAVIGSSVPPAVQGDPLRIKQVLRNLVSNALKFTPAGSVIVSAQWSQGNCTIDVADTGRGIPIDRRESIFEAFVQADGSSSRRQGGSGLGLAIGRQLSEAMGGQLSLMNSSPRGSTFRLVLPLPVTDEIPPDDQSQRNLQSVKGRILVAEDDDASRYVAQTLLESLECPARIVANGIEALELMRSEEFDLALLDCEMPGLDGYEVTARIRQMGGRHIPIIAMTASAMSADRQRCFDAGMDDVLSKPFGKSALNDMLIKWLAPSGGGGQFTFAEELARRPELESEVFEELRQSLNWQLPPLRKIYGSVRESAQKAVDALRGGEPPDTELAARRLHSLQGGAGLVGARQIEFVAARMGQALKQQQPQDLAEGMPLLVDAVRRFERVLEKRLDTLSGR